MVGNTIFHGRVIDQYFADEISWMAYNKVSFQLKMILSSEFPHTKFVLLIDHPRKLQKNSYRENFWLYGGYLIKCTYVTGSAKTLHVHMQILIYFYHFKMR